MITINDNDYYEPMETAMDIVVRILNYGEVEVDKAFENGSLRTMLKLYFKKFKPESYDYFRDNLEISIYGSKQYLIDDLTNKYGGLDLDREMCCYDLGKKDGTGQFWY
jgi:hypothetical protein